MKIYITKPGKIIVAVVAFVIIVLCLKSGSVFLDKKAISRIPEPNTFSADTLEYNNMASLKEEFNKHYAIQKNYLKKLDKFVKKHPNDTKSSEKAKKYSKYIESMVKAKFPCPEHKVSEIENTFSCEKCKGKGQRWIRKCQSCNGSGKIRLTTDKECLNCGKIYKGYISGQQLLLDQK